MEGIVRSKRQVYNVEPGGTVSIQIPYQDLHVFEVQIFFPIVTFYWKETGANDFAPIVSQGSLIGGIPLRFYCNPEHKRSDVFEFILSPDASGDNYTVVAVFSYIDK